MIDNCWGKYTRTIVLISFLQPSLINKLKTFPFPLSQNPMPIQFQLHLQYHKEYYSILAPPPFPPNINISYIYLSLVSHLFFFTQFPPQPPTPYSHFLPVHRLRLHWLENWKTLLKRYPQLNYLNTPNPHFKINTLHSVPKTVKKI